MWEFKVPKQGSKVDANLAQHPQKFEMEYPQDEEKNRQTAVHIIFTTCLWMFSHKILVKARTIFSTDKETDESWEIFII